MMTELSKEEQEKNIIKRLNYLNQIVQTVYVDDSIGVIEISKTIKEYNIARSIVEKIEFKLKSHRILVKPQSNTDIPIIISDIPANKTICADKTICQCVYSNIINILISEMSTFNNVLKYNFSYFNQSLFKKICNRNKKEDLLNRIKDISGKSSWIIMPLRIFNQLKDFFNYEKDTKKYNSIFFIGKLNSTSIYVNPNESELTVYFGNYDSLTLLLNKNTSQKQIKNSESKTITIDYLLLETGIIKALYIN